jgi:hypothetical protein
LYHFLLAFFVLFSIAAWAQDRPTGGFVENTKEVSSIQYDCSLAGAGELSCKFVQSSVRKKLNPRELPSELAKLKQAFASEKPPNPAECGVYEQIANIIKNDGVGAPDPSAVERVRRMSAAEKKDVIALGGNMAAYCRTPTEENYVKAARFNLQKDTRTCIVSSHQFSQRFRQPPNSSRMWVSNEGPQADCGFVVVATFEQDPKYPTLWTYKTQKIVTNSQGKTTLGLSCSGFDTSEHVFDWRSSDHFQGCDYVKFGP